MINNPAIQPKGESYTINASDMEQMATTGVGKFVALSNTSEVDLDKVASDAQSILKKYKDIAFQKEAKDGEGKKNKDFPGGTEPTENYDLKVRADEEKRVKDNIRDESKTVRPDFKSLKPFAEIKESLIRKMGNIDILLKSAVGVNERNRLNLLKDKIVNDLAVVATMEKGDWANPESTSEKDVGRSGDEKRIKNEDTGEKKNDLNDLLKRATFEEWKARQKSETLVKKAEDELLDKNRKDLESTVTELKKNDEEYAKDISTLEGLMGKSSATATAPKEEPKGEEKSEEKGEEKKEDKSEGEGKKLEEKDKGKEKAPEKKDDGKGKKKFPFFLKKKVDKKPSDIKDIKKDGPIVPEKGELPPADLKDTGKGIEPQIKKPFKDDLTAVFNPKSEKTASYWEVKDNENNVILSFSGADAYGKRIFSEWGWFSNKEYGQRLLERIRKDGIKIVAGLVNGKYRMTKHASMLEYRANGLNKEAKIDPKKYYTDYFGKNKATAWYGQEMAKELGGIKRYKGADALSQNNQKLASENEELKKKVAEMTEQLNQASDKISEKEEKEILRSRAEKALKLANKMLSKGLVKKEKLEETVEKLTVMDDISFSMMTAMVDEQTMEKVSESMEKKAFKVKQGFKNLILIPSKNETQADKLTSAFMNKPKYAAIQKYYSNKK
ncbi:MAG: hypothetical protein PHS93_08260 [Candidatus Omnitrophica bacterium]|nr:hypothetical protein [Candidatus Omnitrophota bacterium]MDD5589125.1 hypothetical protein [Candidatus Nanoarchaeia archaeon]